MDKVDVLVRRRKRRDVEGGKMEGLASYLNTSEVGAALS